jgi:hypothetical protein
MSTKSILYAANSNESWNTLEVASTLRRTSRKLAKSRRSTKRVRKFFGRSAKSNEKVNGIRRNVQRLRSFPFRAHASLGPFARERRIVVSVLSSDRTEWHLRETSVSPQEERRGSSLSPAILSVRFSARYSVSLALCSHEAVATRAIIRQRLD